MSVRPSRAAIISGTEAAAISDIRVCAPLQQAAYDFDHAALRGQN
jgi:hypothetical protein